jgi:hypothetical protein
MLLLYLEDSQMDRKELAYAKQAVLGIKDWDAFQSVIRTMSKAMRPLCQETKLAVHNHKGC